MTKMNTVIYFSGFSSYIRKPIGYIKISMALAALIVLGSSQTSHAAYPHPVGEVYVEHVASGQRINMHERQNGGKVILHPKDDSIDQKLWIEQNPDGWTFSLWVDNTYARLSTQANPVRDGIGTEVWMSGKKGSPQQTMRAIPREGYPGQYLLEFVINGKTTGQCLDVNGGANYVRPLTWTCNHGNKNQGFSIISRGSSPPPSSSTGRLRYLPFYGNSVITQGNNGSYSHNNALNRYAIDFGLSYGQPVAAVAKGTVVFAGFVEQWGNHVVIKYEGTEVYGHYLHLSQINVSYGELVSGGQKIGAAGNSFATGKTVATHLHYHEANGVRKNSVQMHNFQENIRLADNGKDGPNIPVTSQNYPGRN
jgi:murein DD-endopeptidase MepM/ murein hydrolase activator NlpD